MRVAVVGAGAIGGYLGARLALAGEEVSFIARGRNLEAIRGAGLKLVAEDGAEQVANGVLAVENPAEAGTQDAVLLTVKAHQVAALAPSLASLCHEDTVIVTMQNGIPWWYFHGLPGEFAGRSVASADPDGTIAAHIDPARVIGSVVYPAAELVAPGVVQIVEGNRFSLGELDGRTTPRIEALAGALTRAGFKAPVSSDIRSEIWLKLWGNLSFNPISALTHATLEDICRFPASRSLAAAMMTEARAIGEKLGARFRISLEKRIEGAERVGAHKTSMLQDVEHGRALELDALVGAVAELGRVTGTPTPAIDAVYACTSLLAKTLADQRGHLKIEPND
ncbi:MAG: 2-dehydropantoate 2-reductase [Betaproteobacteria bacterium]|nr:2-dehydropantoate 2-reductase [Betaproteobacteria bacterium]